MSIESAGVLVWFALVLGSPLVGVVSLLVYSATVWRVALRLSQLSMAVFFLVAVAGGLAFGTLGPFELLVGILAVIAVPVFMEQRYNTPSPST